MCRIVTVDLVIVYKQNDKLLGCGKIPVVPIGQKLAKIGKQQQMQCKLLTLLSQTHIFKNDGSGRLTRSMLSGMGIGRGSTDFRWKKKYAPQKIKRSAEKKFS